MKSLKSKLDDIFNDKDAELILGPVDAKKHTTRAPHSKVEKNFTDVIDFFERHNRLPHQDGDQKEVEAWYKLDAICKNKSFMEQVRWMDNYSVIAMHIASGQNNSSNENPEDQPNRDRLSNAYSNVLKAISDLDSAAKDLGNNESSIEIVEFLEGAAASITSITDELKQRNQVVNEVLPDQHSLSEPESSHDHDNLSYVDGVRRESVSLDDIFNDDEFNHLIDSDTSFGDKILGGQRAIKAIDKDNIDQTSRSPCPTFDSYRERFEKYKQAMDEGKLIPSIIRNKKLNPGDLFLWDGFIALLSGESIEGDVKEHSGKRLHVVFSNGTEAWLREGSINRSMYAYSDRGNKVVCKRLISVEENLFSADDSDTADASTITGYIYVVRTLSNDPGLAKIRSSAVKIGVTKNPVAVRLSNAEKDPTFLCAPVEILNTFALHNLDRKKVEETLHAFFGEVRLKIGAKDRFNNDVTANEWFLTSSNLVEAAVKHLVEGRLSEFRYDKASGKIVKM